jgi:molecular chaperone GrpE
VCLKVSSETNTNEETINAPGQNDSANTTAQVEEVSVEQLRQQLADEQKKSAEYLDSWQRSRADFLNLKRRTEQERVNLSAEARSKIIIKLLPVVDDFERALQTIPEAFKNEPWINGITLIEKKLKTLLDQENVTEIPAEDQEFDPRVHEAVQKDEDGEGDKEYVTAVYQKGYKLGDKVIRAAVVKVGRQKSNE